MEKREFRINIEQALNSFDYGVSSDELDFIVELMYNEKETWYFNDYYQFGRDVCGEDGDYIYIMRQYDALPELNDYNNEIFVRDWFADHKQAIEDVFKYAGIKNVKDYHQILLLDLDILAEWLRDHKQAYRDCLIYVSKRIKNKK